MKGVQNLEFSTFYQWIAANQSALRHFYQDALRHEQLEDAFSSEFQWEWLVVVFCSDSLVKQCEGDCARVGL